MKIKPITPNDVIKHQKFPDEVIAAFNEAIANNWNGGNSSITQFEITELIKRKFQESAGHDNLPMVFDLKYLNVEPLYESMGWKVSYNKPAYNESYKPFFLFSRK